MGLMVIFEIVGRFISISEYYKSFHWFFVNTLRNKCYDILLKRLFYIFLLWRLILRHLRHLLALRQESHKPPFCLGQLICIFVSVFPILTPSLCQSKNKLIRIELIAMFQLKAKGLDLMTVSDLGIWYLSPKHFRNWKHTSKVLTFIRNKQWHVLTHISMPNEPSEYQMKSQIWDISAFQVLNPHQWSSAS